MFPWLTLLQSVLLAACIAASTSFGAPVSIAYRGQLSNTTAAENNPQSLQFTLFDAPTNGTALATNLCSVRVESGQFQALLQFDDTAFDGAGSRWIEIALLDKTSIQTLQPRQQITDVPRAAFARRSSTADLALSTRTVEPGAVTAGAFAATNSFAGAAALVREGDGLKWISLGATNGLRFGAPAALPEMWVYSVGSSICLRSAFNASNDVILTLARSNQNGVMSFSSYALTPSGSSVGVQPAAQYWISDDTCPMSLDNTAYAGANHGWNLPSVTVSNHGLTTADIGKSWTTGANQFALYRILTTHTLLLVPKAVPYGLARESIYNYAFNLPAKGSLAPLTATAPLAYSATTMVQDFPCGRVLANTFTLDGRPYSGGMLHGSELAVECSMEFPDVCAAFDYATNHPGQSFSIASNLPAWFTRTQIYRFHPWGQIGIEEHLFAVSKSLSFSDGKGPVQNWILPPAPQLGATNLFLWAPGSALKWGVPALNHSNLTTYFNAAQRQNPQLPVSAWVQWCAVSNTLAPGSFLWGSAVGYENVWDTADAARAANPSDGWINGATLKIYPSAIVGKSLQSPASLHFSGWRSLFSKDQPEGLLCCLPLLGEKGWRFFAGWNTPGTSVIPIPRWMGGLSCGVERGTGGTVQSSTVDGTILLQRQAPCGWLEIWVR